MLWKILLQWAPHFLEAVLPLQWKQKLILRQKSKWSDFYNCKWYKNDGKDEKLTP